MSGFQNLISKIKTAIQGGDFDFTKISLPKSIFLLGIFFSKNFRDAPNPRRTVEILWVARATGNDISTYYNSLYPATANNIITSITNPTSSAYAVHQSGGWASTNYEVHFDDYSVVQLGDEIRMSLWVADETDGWWINSLGFNPNLWYMFHNRIYYTDGTFSSNGAVEVLDTQSSGWKTWRKIQVKNQVTKSPQDFSWYIWLDAEDTRDLYFTGVELELYRR